MIKIRYILVFVPLLTLYVSKEGTAVAQSSENKFLFRFYEDNDFLNIRGRGTDQAYTNGLRLDLFFSNNKSRRGLNNIYPKAGPNSIDIHNVSLMQLMYTPKNLGINTFQPDDYLYSGAIIFNHSLFSYNSQQKYSVQSGVTVGFRGSASMAEKLQKCIHHLIRDEIPQGWKYQLKTSPIVNINWGMERQILSYNNHFDLIGGLEADAGTMSNNITAHVLIRTGLMNSYFGGYIRQHSSTANEGRTFQFYLIFRPKISMVLSNSMVRGEFTYNESGHPSAGELREVNRYLAEINYGCVISYKGAAISFTQKPVTAYLKGLYAHNVGNISLYFSW